MLQIIPLEEYLHVFLRRFITKQLLIQQGSKQHQQLPNVSQRQITQYQLQQCTNK